MKTHVIHRAALCSALILTAVALPAQVVFVQKNLVSDIPGLAAHTDAHLVNPWGIATSATSPFWVSNAGTASSTLYNTTGTPLPLVVSIPGGGGAPGVPTGQVFNSGVAAGAFHGDAFIFASATGAIAGWRGALGTNAEVLFDESGSGASYLGLAEGVSLGTNYLYAADFAQNKIDVFNNGGLTLLGGSFTDPTLPAGYSTFNIQRIGTSLFATYALKDANGEEIVGPGLGLVNEFTLDGQFVRRFATGGALDAPWGLAIAPKSFGQFGGDLLIGNFGDGTINAFDLTTGMFQGTLSDAMGNPLVNEGLWGIKVGNGGNGGKTNTLYFAAGIDDETHGLFGSIRGVPDSGSTLWLMTLAFPALLAVSRASRLRVART